MKRIMAILLITIILLPGTTAAYAQGEEVVSLGANLTQEQQEQMLKLFNVSRDDVKVIKVTIEEERAYLEGFVGADKIGSRSISSAYVKPLEEGEGIIVETHNISWVTKEMYANAMVTAGVENAHVIAAAPFSVSGTAALTGIIKAFEEASGKDLSEEAKQAANEELVTTGELGDEIGKDRAAELIREIKERIAKEEVKSPEDIKRIIIEIAAELNINLTQEQIDQILSLMDKISKLDLNVEKLASQLENITSKLDDVRKKVEENKGILQAILDGIQGFFKWIVNLFK